MAATNVPVAHPRWSGRRRWGLIAAVVIAVVALSGLAGALVVRHLDNRYGPVDQGPFSGPYAGFPSGHLRLAPTPGASGQVIGSLSNEGAHAVTVSGLSYGQYSPAVSDIRWSTWRMVAEGSVYGISTPWHSFPATIPAQGTIRLLISVHRPADCTSFERAGLGSHDYDGGVLVHWKSLLHSHATDVMLTAQVRVC